MRPGRLLALFLLFGALLAACGGVTATIELVDAGEAYQITQDPPPDLVVLDVRTPEEYASGHLAGATLVDFQASDFAERIDAMDKDVPYLVYCRSGNRSEPAVSVMRDLGFREVYEIDGGIVAWADGGFPLTTS